MDAIEAAARVAALFNELRDEGAIIMMGDWHCHVSIHVDTSGSGQEWAEVSFANKEWIVR